jgi:hypothetical protein
MFMLVIDIGLKFKEIIVCSHSIENWDIKDHLLVKLQKLWLIIWINKIISIFVKYEK